MTRLTWVHRIYFAAVGLLALRVGYAGYFTPAEIGQMIPWQVPPLHSRFLGAMYLSGLVFMIGAVVARLWCEVRAVLPMIAIWTGMLFVVSLFHRNEFDYSLSQVWVWYGAYFAYPVFGAWFAWRHRADQSHPPGSAPLAGWARNYLYAQGAVLTLAALALLIAPTAMIAFWPWKATPLLLQIYAAPFLSYGLGSVILARQRVWLEVRLGAAALFTFSALILAASVLHRNLFSLAENPDRIWFALFGIATAMLGAITVRAFVASAKSTTGIVGLLVGALACGLGAGRAQAATTAVTGQFVIAGKTLTFGEVAAFRIRDQFNPRAFETYVVVSAQAVDKATIGASLDPYALVINDPAVMNDSFLGFSVSGNGEIDLNARYEGTQYIDSSGKIMGQTGSLVASCLENTAARVACSVKTAKPVKTMDGPEWSIDLAFESDVLSRPAGTPLPADGGDAGKAFLALRKAVAGNDLAKILALMTPEQGRSYQEDWRSAEENLASAKDVLDARLPKKPKITGGELLAADHALLEVEGVPWDDGKMLYVVEMRKVEGKWVWADGSVAGMLR